MDNKTKYKMSSQMRLNEISRPTANMQCDHHHRTSMYRPLSPGCHCHHMMPTSSSSGTANNETNTAAAISAPSALASVHPPSSSSLGDSSSCICSHHYHYIQHHRPNSPNPRTSTPPLPPPLLPERIGCCQSTCEDNNDRQISGATHVAVTVHQHQHQHHVAPPSSSSSSSAPTAAIQQQVSQQQHSMHHHQYQALDETTNDEQEDCECCEANGPSGHHHANTDHPSGRSSSRLVSADEIIPSGSEDNAAILQRCCQHNNHHRKSHRYSNIRTRAGHTNASSGSCSHVTHPSCRNRLGDQLLSSKARAGSMQKRSRIDEENYSTGIEVYSDGADSGVKVTDGATSEEDQGPPLPPRPPPRPRNVPANFNLPHSTGIKKYVVWCLICGGFSCLLGVLFLGVYFLLHSYTITVGNFETVPTFVPATLLILTGLCIMSLARRRNRYSYLIKLSGACGLVSALTCALVTVTTTVLHMSRLQALRECEYAQKTRTCTCYSDMIESQVERVDKEGVRLVFDSLSDCGVVHGSLYSCLRAIFGLSVAGVLVAVFSCMLVYQLLSHERKKMYWEQLELRCRSLYTTSQQGPPPNGPMPPNGPPGVISGPRANMCRCCEQCHAHRQALAPTGYPWDAGADGRFWTGQPPGNFYSPNPGGDDLNGGGGVGGGAGRGLNQNSQRARAAGWSWPRMPWQRSSPDPNSRYRQTPSSPDSQYGFSNNNQGAGGDAAGVMTDERVSCSMAHQNQQAAFNVMANGLPYGVWGPPPPYSDPNSPARRGGRYQYMHSHSNQCQNMMMERQMTGAPPQSSHSQIPNIECHQHSSSTDSHSMEPFCSQQATRNMIKRQSGAGGNGVFKTPKGTYENTPSDSDGPRDRFSNTLPVRKTKKRVVEVGAKSIGPNSHSTQRVNVQNVFMENEYHEPNPVGVHHEAMNSTSSGQSSSCQQPKIKRLKTGAGGVENSGFQNNGENLPDSTEEGGNGGSGGVRNGDATESEVYFADVSSCCNVSVKNDNYYDDANQHHPSSTKDKPTNQPKDQSSEGNENEDYLAQRFGQRENSVRCRLPFPQQSRVEHDQLNLPVQSRQGLIPKDISRQSMCSVDSGEKTDFTDLSPATPCTNFAHPSSHFPSANSNNVPSSYANQTNEHNDTAARSNFVASFPFSSEQSQEAHRRSTKNIQDVVFLAPDAQYEVIKEPNQFENTPLTMATYDNEVSFKSAAPQTQSHFQKSQHHTPIKRPNISSIIQNLGNTDMGLLYPDSRRDGPSDVGHQILSKVERPGHLTASENEWSDSSDRRL